jgi:hypothetical protein
MTADEIITRLIEVDNEIERHKSAAWLLERDAAELRQQLRASNWVPPSVPTEKQS